MTKRPDADGRLVLACAYRDGRSRLRTVRFDGLSRASRALPDAGGAVAIVTAALGPGLIAGDRVVREIDVETGATLVVTSQMATPVFAGSAPARSEGRSRVADDAKLYAPGEVLLLAPGAAHDAHAWVDVAGDGLAFVAEIAALGPRARLRSRTTAAIDGQLVLRDACDLEGDRTQRPLLTAIAVTADAARRAALSAAFTAVLAADPAVHGGVGATGGAAIVRARAAGVWALQRFLDRIVAAARAERGERCTAA